MAVTVKHLIEARLLAEKAHDGQKRWGGESYFHTHCVAVGEAAAKHGLDHMIVGLLHDTVEDTDVTLADLSERFPVEVVDAVDALSQREGETYGEYMERVVVNEMATRVKLCDLAHNMSTLHEGDPKRNKQRKGKYQVGSVLCRLALALHETNPSPLDIFKRAI